MTDATTLNGYTVDDVIGMVLDVVGVGERQSATRPPDPRHDLSSKQPCTVKSVSDDAVFVQLDADEPGVITAASPGAAASPEQRGNVITGPTGTIVWIGGSPVDTSGGPVLRPPSQQYQAVPVSQVGNGDLDAAWDWLGTSSWVAFSVDLFYGTTTSSPPAFRLPVLPVSRRFSFSGLLYRSGTTRYGMEIVTDTAGSVMTLFPFVESAGMQALTAAMPGGLVSGSRISFGGVYEAQS